MATFEIIEKRYISGKQTLRFVCDANSIEEAQEIYYKEIGEEIELDIEDINSCEIISVNRIDYYKCSTCNNEPTNHGQRDSCKYEGLPEDDELHCCQEKGYPQYDELPEDHLYPKYSV